MKKFLMLAAVASFYACANDTKNETAVVDTDSVTTTTTTTSTASNDAYAAGEGDVTRRDGKVLVMRNGQWVEADADVRLENGVVVMRNGRVVRDGKEVELEEGEVVNKTGAFFDRTGRAIENAWDATKEGVKDAGREVGDAAKKVGAKAKDAVTDDDHKH